MKMLLTHDPVVLVAFMLNVVLQVTAISLVALVVARCLFRRDPSVRYSVCLMGLVCMLLSPCIVCALSKAGYGSVSITLPTTRAAQVLPPPIMTGGTCTVSHIVPSPVPVVSPSAPGFIRWSVWAVMAVWTMGACWGTARFVQGWRRASRITEGIRPLESSVLRAAMEPVERTLGPDLPPVYTSKGIMLPVAIGLFRPVVILPEALAEILSPLQLRHVLLHECAHVAFRHGWGGMIQRIAGVLFWLHPLVGALCRELTRAREEVCDNVASQEEGAACYARTLLAIAQGISTAPNYFPTLALLGPGTSLEDRITGLLDPRRSRMVHIKPWKLWTVTSAVVFTIALAATVRVVAAESPAHKPAKHPTHFQTPENVTTSLDLLDETADLDRIEIAFMDRLDETADKERLDVVFSDTLDDSAVGPETLTRLDNDLTLGGPQTRNGSRRISLASAQKTKVRTSIVTIPGKRTISKTQATVRKTTRPITPAQRQPLTISVPQTQKQVLTVAPSQQVIRSSTTIAPVKGQISTLAITPAQGLTSTTTIAKGQTSTLSVTPTKSRASTLSLTPAQSQIVAQGSAQVTARASALTVTTVPSQATTLSLTPMQKRISTLSVTPVQSQAVTLRPSQVTVRTSAQTVTSAKGQNATSVSTPEKPDEVKK